MLGVLSDGSGCDESFKAFDQKKKCRMCVRGMLQMPNEAAEPQRYALQSSGPSEAIVVFIDNSTSNRNGHLQ